MASRPSKNGDELVFLPLGGAGEIGMNVYLYGFGPPRDRRWIMVDLGVKFGEDHEPGIDVVLPDLSFIQSERRNLMGIVLTHAHEDHFGAVAYLWHTLKVPIYATRFTATLLTARLEERGLDEDVELTVVPAGHRFDLGPFDLELVSVNHSIPEPNALAIRTPLGTIVHSGDWKIDMAPVLGPPIDEARLREIGEEQCDVLVCDSTNALREGSSPSEEEVAASLSRIIAAAPKRVAVTTFASHVARLETIARAAHAAGRQVVVAGRAMHTVLHAARASGYLKDMPPPVSDEEFGYLPPEKVVCLCTGSQGEPRAALARIADDTHPTIALERGDLVIFSSKTIPGNEKAVISIENNLAMRGIHTITADEALVHVTGHPRRDELRRMYEWLRPKLLIPMHGEMRHLMEHADFARECGVPQAEVVRNGEMMRLAPGLPRIIDEAPAGRLHLDGMVIVPAEGGPARQRRKLAFAGAVVVSLVIDERGEMAGEPKLVLEGLPETDANGHGFDEIILDIVDEVLDGVPRARRREPGVLDELLRRAVRRGLNLYWGKKPACTVLVHRV